MKIMIDYKNDRLYEIVRKSLFKLNLFTLVGGGFPNTITELHSWS
jgi:hypothetical protein